LNLFPTRATFHVAMAGAAMIASGVAMHRAAPVAFGGALFLTLAIGRGLSLLAVTRLRQAGFEMAWMDGPRVVTLACGEPAVLAIELKNRGKDAARVVGLRAVASSLLRVEVVPGEMDLPPGSVATLEMRILGERTGRWGVHGLALELRGMPLGGEGFFEAPLVFSSPFGVDVQPGRLVAMLRSPRGGRSGRVTEVGRSARARGEGDELRELRDHVVGDPWKRIAWRASARKNRLIVREMERQERDVVWLVVDVSVEGWAGRPGTAPMDRAVDEVAAVAVRHLSRGDRVGLAAFASRPRAWITPAQGPKQAALIASALAGCSSMIDVDRSALDEYEVGQRVAEHLRPLLRDEPWPRMSPDLERLASFAESMRPRAPVNARVPYAPSPRERTLRHYLACFGVEGPPTMDGERARAEPELGRTLSKLAIERPRPSIIAVWAPAPTSRGTVTHALRTLRARRIEVRWTVPDVLPSVGTESLAPSSGEPPSADGDEPTSVAASVDAAVRVRARAERARALLALRKLGVLPRAGTTRWAEVVPLKPAAGDGKQRGDP
jgi:uncharacterized protein (DUF58 family)